MKTLHFNLVNVLASEKSWSIIWARKMNKNRHTKQFKIIERVDIEKNISAPQMHTCNKWKWNHKYKNPIKWKNISSIMFHNIECCQFFFHKLLWTCNFNVKLCELLYAIFSKKILKTQIDISQMAWQIIFVLMQAFCNILSNWRVEIRLCLNYFQKFRLNLTWNNVWLFTARFY